MKVALICLATLAGVLLSGVSAQKKMVCYYTNWSAYRPGLGKFEPKDIESSLCTHILYSFLIARDNKVVVHDKWLDVQKGFFNQVVGLKQRNPELKLMIAVGGWNNGGGPFHTMAKTRSGRTQFINSAIKIMNDYGFDGVDLDWEYPGLRGGDPTADKGNFNSLIQEFQQAFNRYARQHNKPKPLLSAAVGPAPKTANISYDRNTVCRELDFVNLMQYDIHGAWDKETGYAAPLRSTPGESTPENVLAKTTQDWIDAGCARDKLIFGLPLYGRGWTTDSRTIPSAAMGEAAEGRFTRSKGMLSYYEICENLSNGWTETYNSQAEQAIAYNNRELFTYDNVRSLQAKVDYLNQMNLGGAMVWALDFDDFTGSFCGAGKYPLLNAINRRLGRTLPVTSPPPPPTTTDPSCTVWWCPNSTTTTRTTPRTTRRTTTTIRTTRTTPRTTTTTQGPTGNCKPRCPRSQTASYHADQCDPLKFYVCFNGRLYSFNCGAGTKYDPSCTCCQRL